MRWRWVALALLVVPLVELWFVLQVGEVIGGLATVALLLLVSAAGAWLLRREGTAAWRGVQEALRAGRAPTRELVDGALVLVGGTLLLTPGFLTDVVGLLLVVPPTRAVARRLVLRVAAGRLALVVGRARPGSPVVPEEERRRRSGGVVPGRVVEGEVVDPPERPGP